MSFVVAIDGPAGSGKGTIAKKISKELGLVNLDTGATYRCVALQSIKENVPLSDEKGIIKLLDNINIQFEISEPTDIVKLNGKDVTKDIRTKEVTNIVSQVSSIKEVRFKMVDVQRKMAQGKNVVMEGRDIGTYVFPNADVKIYLDATLEERAKRRYKENMEKGINTTYEEVVENLELRDKNDKAKEIGALKVAEDAIIIDSTKLSIEQVVEKVKNIIKEKMGE